MENTNIPLIEENDKFAQFKKAIIPGVCLAIGAIGSLWITGGMDIYMMTSRIETIGGKIDENNRVCIQAVEDNKKLKSEYEQKLDDLGVMLQKRMGRTEKTITQSGELVPASIPPK
jgi:hypothetical protein